MEQNNNTNFGKSNFRNNQNFATKAEPVKAETIAVGICDSASQSFFKTTAGKATLIGGGIAAVIGIGYGIKKLFFSNKKDEKAGEEKSAETSETNE